MNLELVDAFHSAVTDRITTLLEARHCREVVSVVSPVPLWRSATIHGPFFHPKRRHSPR